MGLLRSHNQTNNHKSEKTSPAKPVVLSEAKELLLLHSPESETAIVLALLPRSCQSQSSPL